MFRKFRVIVLLTLIMLFTIPSQTKVSGSGGSVGWQTNHGFCWYYDGFQWLEAVYYEYSGFYYTEPGGTTRWFNITTSDSDVCGPDVCCGSATSNGWTMIVSGYTQAAVYNPSGQRVY